MPGKIKKTPLSPSKVMEDLTGGWRARALLAGVELKVFSQIAAGKRTVKEISVASQASPRGMAALLDALTAIGYLRKTGSRYDLQPISAAFLVPGGKMYVGSMAEAISLSWNSWKYLTEAVRGGHSAESVDDPEQGKEFFPKLVASIFPGSFAASSAVVSRLAEKDRRKIRNILDVGAGSGAWSLAFAQSIPQARVETLDFPELTPITRDFAKKLGVADRYSYLERDMRAGDFGHDAYDLVILGHIFHSEGQKHGMELFRKSYSALRPGGKLLMAEYVPNDKRTGPAMPVLFGLTMLLQTEEGNVFTLREYRAWLKAAGFRKMRVIPVPPPSTVIIATK